MNKISEFGTVYTQFKCKPKEAMKHLMKVKEGECIDALYRDDIGYVDIVWGKPHDINGKGGYGLNHIIVDHENELKQLNTDVVSFIIMVFSLGKKQETTNGTRIYLDGNEFRAIVETEWKGKNKKLLLTTYDLRPINRKNPKRAKELENKNKKATKK